LRRQTKEDIRKVKKKRSRVGSCTVHDAGMKV
jgi:hypothetical protein